MDTLCKLTSERCDYGGSQILEYILITWDAC